MQHYITARIAQCIVCIRANTKWHYANKMCKKSYSTLKIVLPTDLHKQAHLEYVRVCVFVTGVIAHFYSLDS